MEVGVTKCHACHAKRRGVTGDQRGPSASPDPAKCHKYHACHAKRRWMSPSVTPVTCKTRGGCRQVPRLPRKVERRHRRPTGTKRVTRPSQASQVPRSATQNEGGCRQVPLLSHVKRRWMSPSAMPATQSGAAARRHGRPTGTKRVTRPSQVSYVPRLPRKMKVDVAKRHPCHAKRPWMSPSATPATQSGTASRATNVDRLPRKTTVGVAKCHACHAKWSGVTGNQRGPSASQDQPSVTSTTLATQNKGGCRQVPRLPRKVARRRHGRPTGTKRITRPSQV